jgi:Fe-S oxidoreductase
MWMDEKQSPRMNEARANELLATEAKQIVTACPFCSVMLGDGLVGACGTTSPSVRDIAEIVEKVCVEPSSEAAQA